MMLTEKQCLLSLWLSPQVSITLLNQLLVNKISLSALFQLPVQALEKKLIPPQIIRAISQADWRGVEKTLAWADAAQNKHIITRLDPHYPDLLTHIAQPPPVLFCHGQVDCLKKPQVAMVGSRKPSPHGIATAKNFAFQLAKQGLVVTSGMALGIDGVSHQGALAANGQTIAVLGSGIDVIYPRHHQALAEKIIEQGVLLSEFPLASQPKPAYFPQRNRIVSGLSLGVIVVEAALRSGSLITARYANEQGREVFAVPGSIYEPLARGCHQLLRNGAKLTETISDVIEELPMPFDKLEGYKCYKDAIIGLDKYQQKLVKSIGYAPTSVDMMVASSQLSVQQVNSLLPTLEMLGVIQATVGGYVKKI